MNKGYTSSLMGTFLLLALQWVSFVLDSYLCPDLLLNMLHNTSGGAVHNKYVLFLSSATLFSICHYFMCVFTVIGTLFVFKFQLFFSVINQPLEVVLK